MKKAAFHKSVAGAVLLVVGIGIGCVFQKLEFSMLSAYGQDRYADLQNFSKVLNMIQQYYVEPVDVRKLIYGAIKGMLRELDPHTNFMPPDIFSTIILQRKLTIYFIYNFIVIK